jgi:hypothetical protein
MSILRKVALLLAGGLLTFWLFMTVTFFALSSTIGSPSYIKTWLAESSVYKNIVAETLKLGSIQKTLELNNTSSSGVELLTPVVQQTLTPEVLQENTETVVDSVGMWLAGDTKNPEFSIEVAPLRTDIINKTADYLYNRVNALPPCQQFTTEYDPLTATCKPPTVLNKQDFVVAATDFSNNLPFMKYDTLTYQSFTQNTNPYWDGSLPQDAPKAYQWLKLSPYIFGILAIVSAVVLIWLRKDHAKAWRSVGHTFLIAGIFLVLGSLLTKALSGRPLGTVGSSSDAQKLFAESIATPLAQHLSLKISDIGLYFGVGFIVISAVCYVVAKYILRKKIIDTHIEQESALGSSSKPSDDSGLATTTDKKE